MSSTIELTIHSLLLDQNSPQEAATSLLFDIHSSTYSTADKISIFHFALQAKVYPQILATLQHWSEKEIGFPWNIFVETLAQLSIRPGQKLLNSLHEGIAACPPSAFHWISTAWDKLDPRFVQLRQNIAAQAKERHVNKIELLKQKIAYLQRERLFDQIPEITQSLAALDPNSDPQLTNQMEEKWAKTILQKFQTQNNQRPFTTKPVLPAKEQEAVDILLKEIKENLPTDPESVYNYALMLYFCGLYNEAAELLPDYAVSDPVTASLQMDTLYQAGQYVGCVELADQIFNESSLPETEVQCNSIYMKSLSLWQLGKKDIAINLLKSLINVDPQFRSAHDILNQWLGEKL